MPERLPLSRRHTVVRLRLICVCALAAAGLCAQPVSTPLPGEIAARLALRAAAARKADMTLRAYLLYTEAAKLDPLSAEYRQNRDALEPFAKLLQARGLETATASDIKADVDACTLEATPGSDAGVASRLAEKAEQARKSGQAVRAYLLFSAAAARYPKNPVYRENQNVLAPVASLLLNTGLEKPDISADIKASEVESLSGTDPAVKAAGADWKTEGSLAALPKVQAGAGSHDFNLRGNSRALIEQVTSVYGIHAIIDPELLSKDTYSLEVTDVDFHAALDALTLVTNTFVFPVSPQVVFFAADTEAKRNELEPNVLLTMSLPESLGEKDLIDVANGVRSVLNLKSFGWDSVNHTLLIRDHFTRAHLAKSLLESLLLPHAQVSLELQFLTIDNSLSYQYGVSPQTSFQLLSPLQKLFNFSTILPTLVSGAEYFALGGGISTFGIGVTSAQVLATYSKSVAKNTYDTTIVVADGETANLHVGEKYPIPQSLYTGASQTASSIYNPIGAFTEEDLGLVLKITPHLNGDGAVSMEIEADYKSLGSLTLNTVPSVSERQFKGSVMLQPDQWAVLAGLDQNSKTVGRTGLAGLTSIPGLNQLLSSNDRSTTKSETLVVLKPTIQRLPVSDAIGPQFLLGTTRGVRVLL